MSAKTIIGNRMVYNSKIFNKDFWIKLTDEMIKTGIDDTYILYYLIKYKIKQKLKFNQNIKNMIKSINEIEPLHNYYKQHNRIETAIILAKEIWK